MDYAIRPATIFDVIYIAENLREADRREALLMWHDWPPEFRAQTTMQQSDRAYVGTVDGVPAVAFGTVPQSLMQRTAIVWLFGTSQMEKHARELIRRRKAGLALVTEGWDRIGNAVHAENALAHAWLRSMGFRIGPVTAMFETRAPFHPFYWRRESGDV